MSLILLQKYHTSLLNINSTSAKDIITSIIIMETARQTRGGPGRADTMYRFNDDNFLRKLNFRPHKPAPGVKGKCNEIPRFLRFKELTEAEMKEKKRIPVPESELQLSGAASSSTPLDIPIYKGTILEKRQKPLTGKESFEGKIHPKWPKDKCVNGGSV